jgi:hypothetical protein
LLQSSDTAGDRLDKGSCSEADAGRQEVGLGRGNHRIFSKTSIDIYAQGCQLQAQMDFAAVAVVTAVAENIRVDTNSVMDPKVGYSLTYFNDLSGIFMAENDGWCGCRLPFDNMRIGSADPRPLDFNQEFSRPWLRHILLQQPQISDFHKASS